MKRVFCPKCDNQLAFDETKYPEGKVLAFVCPQCGSQFKIKLGRKIVRTESGLFCSPLLNRCTDRKQRFRW